MNIQSYSVFLIDHLFVLIFAVLFPVFGLINYRKNLAKLISGELLRRTEYIRTSIIQWVLALMGIALWQFQGRDWAELGLDLRLDGKFIIAAVVVALAIGAFVAQLVSIERADKGTIDKLATGFESVRPLMPHSSPELHAFYGLSVTAGLVEELLWRGFLIGYLSHFMPIWMAAVLSALVFGIGHAYQGIANTPKIAAVGLVFSGLYLLSGSLWLPMVLHIAMDAIQGRTAFVWLRAEALMNKEEGGA